QRTLYERLGLPALDHRVGPRDVRARTTAIVEPLCLVIEGRSSVTRAPTEVLQSVAAVVRRHAVDPRAELGVAAEAVDGAKDGDEDLLREVLRLRAVADHPIDDAVDALFVAANQLDEGPLVLVLQAGDEVSLFVALAHCGTW